jgi:ribosome biogenesis GTPase
MSNFQHHDLIQLGWRNHFQQQLSLEELEQFCVGRIISQHKNSYEVVTENLSVSLVRRPNMLPMTVGDWLLLDKDYQLIRLLERVTLLSRKAPGSKAEEQLIAANVDSLFIVSSMDHDFSLNRIERYLAIAYESGCQPVIVLTKEDCCEDPQEYCSQVQLLDPYLAVISVNACHLNSVEKLQSWCATGNSIALVGSSGVGKSTLINTLMGSQSQSTGEVRDKDSKGRHTTTARSIHISQNGFLLVDTPGVRELQIADCDTGVKQTFSDIMDIANQCRFANCQHLDEPDCAVTLAVAHGNLEQRRLSNYHKLIVEQQRNGRSIAETRSQDRSLSKLIRTMQSDVKGRKGKGR